MAANVIFIMAILYLFFMMVHMFLNFVIVADFFNKIETMFIFAILPSGLDHPTSIEFSDYFTPPVYSTLNKGLPTL